MIVQEMSWDAVFLLALQYTHCSRGLQIDWIILCSVCLSVCSVIYDHYTTTHCNNTEGR